MKWIILAAAQGYLVFDADIRNRMAATQRQPEEGSQIYNGDQYIKQEVAGTLRKSENVCLRKQRENSKLFGDGKVNLMDRNFGYTLFIRS